MPEYKSNKIINFNTKIVLKRESCSIYLLELGFEDPKNAEMLMIATLLEDCDQHLFL